jgi:hypothetical protein
MVLAMVVGCGHTKPASHGDGGAGTDGGAGAGGGVGGGGGAGADGGADASTLSDGPVDGSDVGDAGAAGSGGADGGTTSDTGAGGAVEALACPSKTPLQGADCAGQACVYQDCAGAGLTIALCHPEGSFELQVAACAPAACAGAASSPCATGSLCLKKPVNGVLTSSCLPNPCGTGPITCACATCSGACQVIGDAQTGGVTVTCQTP